MLRRPERDEHAAYFDYYIGLVPEGELQTILTEQGERQVALFSSLAPEQMDYRYAPGKWSVKEVLGHLIDSERIMSYRLLRIARGDQTPLVGFDENAFVEHGYFQLRDLSDLLEEYKAVRASTIAQVRGISSEAWLRTGVANGNKLSARTLAYVIAGHEAHHSTILKERYLGDGKI